jgi:hypothetical protein
MPERDSDHIRSGATTPADLPLEYWRSKFEIKGGMVVWRPRPRENFRTEGEWRVWNKRFAGKEPGSARLRRGRTVVVSDFGRIDVPVENIRIALETGAWPARYGKYAGNPWQGNIGSTPLGQLMLREARVRGLTFADLTVLGRDRDPFRLDTPAYHKIGHWLGEQFNRLVPDGRTIHWRGFHYVLVSAGDVVKPNGKPYENSHEDAEWLGATAAKAARWLGYIDMDRLTDQRTDEPVIFRVAAEQDAPQASTLAMLGVSYGIEEAERHSDAYVSPKLGNFTAHQRYAFAMFGEKSSLAPVLTPIAQRRGSDLYCGAGEISDIYLERMARDAVEDGRPLIVFCFSDFDPAGYQMPVSIGRKLQAFKAWKYSELEFQVVPVALTADQVTRFDLPETPLKLTEKRASRWRERFGREQTEIDALAALRPDDLTRIAEEAFAPYWDADLDDRTEQVKLQWEEEAQAVIDETVDPEELMRLGDEAEAQIDAINEARDRLAALGGEIDKLAEDIELPDPPERPEAEVDEEAQKPLIDSRWGFVEGTRALKARKAYEDEDDDDEG